jgi:hypothetical protein
MGDRTTVILSVLTEHAEEAQKIFKDDPPQESWTAGRLTRFVFHEVNYGELDFLEHLTAAGIAYDSEWGDGSEYGPGCKSCRFTPEGKAIIKALYNSDENPEINLLLPVLDDHEKLRLTILEHIKSREVMPWDNQIEYGKIYQAAQLISN